MVYFPDEDLCDGAAEIESKGFFDVYNTPPWDTWVGYFQDGGFKYPMNRKYLVAYVPANLLALADAGISVNPEECIQWLDVEHVLLSNRLQNICK